MKFLSMLSFVTMVTLSTSAMSVEWELDEDYPTQKDAQEVYEKANDAIQKYGTDAIGIFLARNVQSLLPSSSDDYETNTDFQYSAKHNAFYTVSVLADEWEYYMLEQFVKGMAEGYAAADPTYDVEVETAIMLHQMQSRLFLMPSLYETIVISVFCEHPVIRALLEADLRGVVHVANDEEGNELIKVVTTIKSCGEIEQRLESLFELMFQEAS